MNSLIKFVVVCALIIGGGYAACEIAYPTLYLRYRLTVNIEDNGTVKSGSGVVEVKYKLFPDLNIEGGGARGVIIGNAISVDLGDSGIIFIIDRSSSEHLVQTRRASSNLSALPLVMLGLPEGGRPSILKKAVLAAQRAPREPIEVPAAMMPRLVRFRNIDDANSLQALDATELQQELGPRIRFVSATLQLTDELPTEVSPSWPDWMKHGNPRTELVPSLVRLPAPSWRTDLAGLQISDFVGGYGRFI